MTPRQASYEAPEDLASWHLIKDITMGHSSIQVTVDIHGHLISGANIAGADALDSTTSPQQSATQTQLTNHVDMEDSPGLVEMIGGPSRIRTCDQRIMSPRL